MLNDEQLLRYSRQIMLPDFDVAGQERLLNARVLIVGLGGLGSPVALYLAAAGVGELILADGDRVDVSNLQRQIAHTESRLGEYKVDSAAAAIAALNSDTRVRSLRRRLKLAELYPLAQEVDLVVDACDSFATRLDINLACIRASRPLVSGAAIRNEGQVLVINTAAGSPCYRCIYPQGSSDQELSCSDSGVMSPLVGVIGSLQALEAVKVLTGFGEPLLGEMLLYDGRAAETRRLRLRKRPDCDHCARSTAL